jgi:hypothetical protein
MNTEGQKEKRLHVGGVGPEMRSPAGLSPKDTTCPRPTVNDIQLLR